MLGPFQFVLNRQPVSSLWRQVSRGIQNPRLKAGWPKPSASLGCALEGLGYVLVISGHVLTEGWMTTFGYTALFLGHIANKWSRTA